MEAAVSVADAGAIEGVQELRQQRVSNILMQLRHGPWPDPLSSDPNHDISPGSLKVLQQPRNLFEAIGRVGLTHDGEIASGALEPVRYVYP